MNKDKNKDTNKNNNTNKNKNKQRQKLGEERKAQDRDNTNKNKNKQRQKLGRKKGTARSVFQTVLHLFLGAAAGGAQGGSSILSGFARLRGGRAPPRVWKIKLET